MDTVYNKTKEICVEKLRFGKVLSVFLFSILNKNLTLKECFLSKKMQELLKRNLLHKIVYEKENRQNLLFFSFLCKHSP